MDELTRLLLAAREGDRVAFAAFVRSSQAEVWRLVAHLIEADAADDVTQDVFIRAWGALPAFRGKASARTWLLAIARRACADELRRRSRRRRLRRRIELAHDSDHETVLDGTTTHATTALVDGLAPDRREAFVLTQVIGCSYGEAAAICSVPVGTIRSRVARARADLVEAIAAANAS